MEEEARNILRAALAEEPPSTSNLAAAIRRRFEPLGGIVIEVYSGGTVLCWEKLKRSVEERRASGWSNFLEWFQWLAERMDERAPLASGAPAFEAHRNWTAPSDYFRQRR
jgi:hypothetical protein